MPVATPVTSTEATVGSDVVHVESMVRSCLLPSLYVPVAVNDCAIPMPIEAVPGATAIDCKVAASVVTVKLTPLLELPLTVITTFPVVAPLGTGATIELSAQFVGVALAPLNLTVLLPSDKPKLVPEIVTEAPTAPDVGERPLINGVIVKEAPLLGAPFAVTTTLPLVAPLGTGTIIEVSAHAVGVAVVPLNVKVLKP